MKITFLIKQFSLLITFLLYNLITVAQNETINGNLTVNGDVNVGGNTSKKMRIRHIDGKNAQNTLIDRLYLNYNTEKDVLVGWGSSKPSSNLLVSGKLGLGMTNPSSLLDITNLYESSESFIRFRVADASNDYFEIFNNTSSPSQFIPTIKANHESDNRNSLIMMATTNTSNDNGNSALINFNVRNLNNSKIVGRPLFVWTNYGDRMMTMLSNGNVGIGTTTTGNHKLAVDGSIGAREITVEAGTWSDFVFYKDYRLPTLKEVEDHIQDKGHLQDIPSAKEVGENGIKLGEMNAKLLQKIEELMLYTIQQQKELNLLKSQLKEVKRELD